MRSKIAPLFWVALLSAVPAGLYYLYVGAQLHHITELNQRELGRAAENLKEILRNGVQTVRNLSTNPSYTCTFNDRQPYLKLAEGLKCESFKNQGRPESDIEVEASDDGLRLLASDIVSKEGHLAFQIRLEKALDELVVTDGFEYLFLARGDGAVLFQTRRGERKRWLDQLRWFDRQTRDKSVPVSSPLRLQRVSELQTVAGPITFDKFTSTTNSTPVQIGGSRYRLHVQPLLSLEQLRYEKHTNRHAHAPVKTGDRSEAISLVLGGLVSENATSQEALAIEPLYALVMALLVGVGVLSWPLVKFFVLASRERFKFLDFALLILSTSATLGFLIILFLDAEAYWRFKSLGETRLKTLADQLQKDFTAEVTAMRSQLMHFEARAFEKPDLFQCDTLLEGRRLLDSDENATPADKYFKVTPDDPYPSFVSAFWARGRDGMQMGKLTTAAENTSKVSVASRNYFTEAQSGHLWELASDAEARQSNPINPPKGFFLQTYRSNTTGDFETGLSMRSRLKVCEPQRGEMNVAVLTANMWSFRRRPLPPDLGFMVLDRSGRVLYHIDERRALREDLFEETTNSGSLRAIVLSERPEGLTSSYRGSPHRFWIQPIKDIQIYQRREERSRPVGPERPQTIGWFLVTFQDLELSRTVNSEAMISVLIWGVFYMLAVQFVPAAVFVWLGPKQMSWLWPNRQKASLYARLAIEFAVVTILGIAFLISIRGWLLVAGSCAIGVTGLTIAALEYARWRRSQHQGEREPLAETASPRWVTWSRIAAVSLFFVVVSVLPAAGLFKFSWAQEISAFLRYEQDHIRQTQIDQARELNEHARKVFVRPYGHQWKYYKWVFEARQQAIDRDTIPLYGFKSNDESSDILAGMKPVYNDASAQLRFRRPGPVPPDAPLEATLGWFAIPSGTALLALLVLWIRYATKRLLLAEVTDRKLLLPDVLAAVRAAIKNRENQILVVSSAMQERALRDELELPLLKSMAVGVEGAGQVVVSPAKQGFSLTNTLSDSEARQAALMDVETLAAAGGTVVFSRFDPVEYCLGRALSANDPSFTRTEHRRWAEVLERFSVVHIPLATDDQEGKRDNEAFYWSVWDSCTDLEKLVLLHVTEEGFANPHEQKTVRDLLHRGLLILGPELRVFSAGFQDFLKQVGDSALVKQWEKSGGFGWGQAKWGLTVAIVGVVLFLVSTQRQALGPVMTFVAMLTGAVSGILKLVADFAPKQRSV